MSLLPAQYRALRFVADGGPATVKQVAGALSLERGTARNALRVLADRGLLALDRFTIPQSYAATDAGRLALTLPETGRSAS